MNSDADLDDKDLIGEAGVARVRKYWEDHEIDPEGRILTSRDPGMEFASSELPGRQLPGMLQWQQPVILPGNSLLYMTYLAPHARVPRHKHEGATVFRLIVRGSVRFGDVWLGPGDWMLVPPGEEYELEAGPEGAYWPHGYIPPKPPGP